MTIVLKIRSCYSPDVDDLPGWVPASVDEVYYPLEMEIGEADRSGAHVFGLMIATPQGLAKHHRGRALQAFRNNQARTPGMGRKALLVIDPYR
ncbi:Imm8 family immunity protein [Lysobacter enzymogenes]|nr:Imm8 family immunity protein [Lysobacter enzymogenes]UZW60219.1 immunity 8 family protein [Lysobacter enzymogenes]